jgi:hypothetical protein
VRVGSRVLHRIGGRPLRNKHDHRNRQRGL